MPSGERVGWLQRLEALADRFVPPELIERSPEDARRARFAVGLSWIAGSIFLVASFVQASANTRAVVVLNAASAALCFAVPFALRRFGRLVLLCHVVLAVNFCKYVSVPLLLRGAGLSGATVLLAQLPLMATFLVGVRGGAVWAILSTAASIVIGLLGRAGLIVDRLPAEHRLFNDHFVLAGSTVVLFSIAVLYERKKDAAQRHIAELDARRQSAELERVKAVAKAQLAEAERLASLGRIAAATAHEINNPLTYVMGNLHLLAESLPPEVPADLTAAIHDAVDGAERIGRVVANMRLFAQPREGPLQAVKIEESIDVALQMAQSFTRARARVETRLAAALPKVMADVARLAEVVLNLVINAAQAIPEGHAAEHQILVEARVLGPAVVLEVSDAGHGVSTTGEKGQAALVPAWSIGEGTVLGLALCEGIVQSFGGTMTFEKHDGRTLARITLVAAP
ncbi:MAG TPA: histidine kinase dimerization/phospho-acceptor domain-containing protein [Polyangia bacterium]|nr:histidine kinase dimerization/phospho-acceptor domain-containing protein [Polyangia bacterium]